MSRHPFPHLFQPLRIGPVTVRNRIYMTPHTLCYGDQLPGETVFVYSDRHVAYYGERARNGVGLIITESNFVAPTADYHPFPLTHMYDPRAVEPLRRVTREVHRHGSKFFVQLWHGGLHVRNNDRVMRPSLAPSQLPTVEFFSIPKAMDEADIREIQGYYVRTAENIRAGEADGVEIHTTHTGLMEQFLSPFYNKRADRYGGSLENRMRFLVETLEQVRRAIGPDLALGLRFIADEMLPGGLGLEDLQEIARRIEATGLVDFFDVDLGTYHTLPLLYGMLDFVPAGYEVDWIAGIKAALGKTPVLGCIGKFSDPRLAEEIVAAGKMDMVGGARGHIADPELVRKAEEGRPEDVVPCIACNVFCVDHIYRGLPVNCVLNPVTGREKELAGPLPRAERPKRVLVAGGGCGGMEAARVAALRGHQVTLYEREPELGGLLRLESHYPGRGIYRNALGWFEVQLAKAGVKVELGREVTPELVLAERPDAVVVATGAVWDQTGVSGLATEPIPGWDQPHVVTPDRILTGAYTPGHRVLILDDESMWTAPGLAELLADRGHEVEIVTRWFHVMYNIAANIQSLVIFPRLFNKGIRLTPFYYVRAIEGRSVVTYHIFTTEEERREVDTMVMVTAKRSNDGLYHALAGRVPELYAVGDCVAPRWIGEAVYEGHMLARGL